jgi:hypothetical protein
MNITLPARVTKSVLNELLFDEADKTPAKRKARYQAVAEALVIRDWTTDHIVERVIDPEQAAEVAAVFAEAKAE